VPKLSEMLPSRFLKKEDVPAPILCTIANFTHEEVDKDSGEMKWAMHLQETDKPLAMNSTNLQLCAAIFQSQDTDDWLGKKIVIYSDPTIMFAGKVTGGLRVRAPKNQAPAAPKKPAAPAPKAELADYDDSGIAGLDDSPPF